MYSFIATHTHQAIYNHCVGFSLSQKDGDFKSTVTATLKLNLCTSLFVFDVLLLLLVKYVFAKQYIIMVPNSESKEGCTVKTRSPCLSVPSPQCPLLRKPPWGLCVSSQRWAVPLRAFRATHAFFSYTNGDVIHLLLCIYPGSHSVSVHSELQPF